MVYSDCKRIYEGEWVFKILILKQENDSKHGKGYEFFSNGSTYDGTYVNGKPEGIGTYTWVKFI